MKYQDQIIKLDTKTQVKYHFDKKTSIKIFKGTLLAASGGAALFVLNILKIANFGTLEPLIVILVPALINIVKIWMR